MFSSFFSQVKEGLAAASEPAPPNPPPQAPPSKPAQSEQGENSGGDFLGGLLNVAKEVGQAINEKNQPPPPPPPEPKATDLIGGLLNVVGQAVNEKSQPPPPPPPPPEPKPTDLLGGILNAVGQAINEKNQPPPPPPPPPEPTGADFLGGLLNVVGNAMSDKKEPEVKPPPPTPEKQESGSKITQDDIAMITKGLGALVTSIKEKTATKDVEEEQVAKVDSQGGKVQISSVASTNDVPASQQEQTTSAGGDFFSGLMGMAKEVGKAMNEPKAPPPQQTSHLSQEDIAKITQGLSALVGKAFNKGTAEGEVAQVDSQGGKTSAPADNDFLSGLLNMAKDVGKKLGDQPGAQQSAQASSNAAGNQGSKVTQEDIGKLVLALGPLVNTIKEKTFAKKEEAEKEVGKVDSQGGKVQLSSVQGPTDTTKPAAEQPAQAPAGGGDFLSGLMSVAKDVGKAMNEQQQPQAANGQQLSQEDVAKITAGLGFLGTLIKDKAGDIFQKPAAEEKEHAITTESLEKEKEKPKEEPVIDEVEGEIGKVVLSGYTTQTIAQTIATKSKNE